MQANFRNSRRIALFPVLLIFCLFGCHSDDIPRILRDVATLPEITGVPEEVQILIWDDRETLLAKLAAAEADAAAEYPTLPDGYLEVIRQKICRLDEQRRYYTKYIDAGGITVIGSASVTDREFYSVRDIILRTTAKRPELRKLLSPSGGIPRHSRLRRVFRHHRRDTRVHVFWSYTERTWRFCIGTISEHDADRRVLLGCFCP